MRSTTRRRLALCRKTSSAQLCSHLSVVQCHFLMDEGAQGLCADCGAAKLNPNEGDTQRFNVDDLENWLASTGDAHAVVEYLAAKFLDNDDRRKVRLISRVEGLAAELASALNSLKAAA